MKTWVLLGSAALGVAAAGLQLVLTRSDVKLAIGLRGAREAPHRVLFLLVFGVLFVFLASVATRHSGSFFRLAVIGVVSAWVADVIAVPLLMALNGNAAGVFDTFKRFGTMGTLIYAVVTLTPIPGLVAAVVSWCIRRAWYQSSQIKT